MILVIDNYDSFAHNLVRYFECEGETVRIVRNDAITVEEILLLDPLAIVISPGPCSPDQAGISLEIVQKLGDKIPILGVCLGHQAIGQAYGGKTLKSQNPMHGKPSLIDHDKSYIFKGLHSPIQVARYHSLVTDIQNVEALIVTARTLDGEIMAISHKEHPVYGVQFHPESILTEQGDQVIRNFIALAHEFRANLPTRRAA